MHSPFIHVLSRTVLLEKLSDGVGLQHVQGIGGVANGIMLRRLHGLLGSPMPGSVARVNRSSNHQP